MRQWLDNNGLKVRQQLLIDLFAKSFSQLVFIDVFTPLLLTQELRDIALHSLQQILEGWLQWTCGQYVVVMDQVVMDQLLIP